MADRTDRPDGQDEGGYYRFDDPDGRLTQPPPESTVPTPARPQPAAEEPPARFKRQTPAKVKPIAPERPGRPWGLAVGSVVYALVSASLAGFLPVGTRVAGHVLFWLVIAVSLLVSLQRERANEWDPAPRWPWAVSLIGATLTVELLVALFAPSAIIIGSVVVLSAGLLILLMLG
ncbi:transcriptional regulator [Nocardiopsis ansamitocini]|uniref:Uncharacterized protein n=1 Tax=Nocardiopsis ansamitocini TaxID=1670832 RepID=A0A9W6UI16_9ACTN|nr:transcriptional regulator [Nocardiopsis ansamitocini]GLU46938.1 hypothetical protein Nans01_12890 [Nocardiopsis ansamitocini]